jgi:hypothetical protein
MGRVGRAAAFEPAPNACMSAPYLAPVPRPMADASDFDVALEIGSESDADIVSAQDRALIRDSAGGRRASMLESVGPTRSLQAFVRALNARYPDTESVALDLGTVADLVALGLDEDLADELLVLAVYDAGEQDVVTGFLACLLDHDAGASLSRHVRRLIRKAAKDLNLADAASRHIAALLDPGDQ